MKLLTILNTVAIVVLFYFAYQFGFFSGNTITEIPEEEVIEEEVEAEEDMDKEMAEKDVEVEIEEEGTLTLDEFNNLNGFVDLTGYLVTESVISFGEPVEQAFFAFNQTSDDNIKTFIDAFASSGNTVNRKSGGTYFLGLGCNTGDEIDNFNFKVTGDSYRNLLRSSGSNFVVLRAFFNNEEEGGIGGPCLSFAETVQIVD